MPSTLPRLTYSLLLCLSLSGATLLPAPLACPSGRFARFGVSSSSIGGGRSDTCRRRRNAVIAPSRKNNNICSSPGYGCGSARRRRQCAAFVDPAAVTSSVSAFARSSPLVTAFISCAINGFAADWIAQSSEAVRRASLAQQEAAAAADGSAVATDIGRGGFLSQYDFRRALAFILYGGLYQGMALEIIYNGFFTRIFGPQQVFLKVAASQFILAPLVTLPVAYMFKGLVFGNTFKRALEDYWTGVTRKGLLFSFWKLWIPIQFLVFAVIPMHLRIPFSACFSFLWTVMLSRIANSQS